MKIAKLSMPGKGKKKPAEMDMESLFDSNEGEENQDMANELVGESEGESDMDEPAEEVSGLEEVSDEDLLAELRKRGLAGKALSAAKKPSPDSEYM